MVTGKKNHTTNQAAAEVSPNIIDNNKTRKQLHLQPRKNQTEESTEKPLVS